MLKKLLFVITPLAPLAVVMAMATAPTPASADYICQAGTPSSPTPTCFYYCRVPFVVGLKLHLNAIPDMHTHDCHVKSHFPKKKKGRKFRRWVVKSQSPGRGTAEKYDYVVQLYVKAEYYPVKHHKP